MKTIRRKANLKQPAGPRPKLLPISEEMRHWCALLDSELLSWPGVIAKIMFGFRTFYHRKTIFAAIPHTRGFGSASSILLKFKTMPPALLERAESDSRLVTNTPGKRWFSFTLSSDTDLHDALEWLNHSYESAKKGNSR